MVKKGNLQMWLSGCNLIKKKFGNMSGRWVLDQSCNMKRTLLSLVEFEDDEGSYKLMNVVSSKLGIALKLQNRIMGTFGPKPENWILPTNWIMLHSVLHYDPMDGETGEFKVHKMARMDTFKRLHSLTHSTSVFRKEQFINTWIFVKGLY